MISDIFGSFGVIFKKRADFNNCYFFVFNHISTGNMSLTLRLKSMMITQSTMTTMRKMLTITMMMLMMMKIMRSMKI